MPYLTDYHYDLLSHGDRLRKLKNSSTITKRLILDYTLNFHRGCVNTICWNDSGTSILSGSDDQNLIVADPFTRQLLVKVHSGHRENIFSAKFLPESNDRRVVSCSGDGVVFHTNFDRPIISHAMEGCFACHGSTTAYEVRIIPHTPNLFLSCADDCTIRLYDLRMKSKCLKNNCHEDILIKSNWGVTSMDLNPMNSNEIICACADASIRLYDHRKLSTQISSAMFLSRQYESCVTGLVSCFTFPDRKDQHPSRITSVVFNPYGTEILASYSSEAIYLLDPKQCVSQEKMKEHFVEHRRKKLAAVVNERKSSVNNEQCDDNKNSHVKQFRLRGDWSDTGPDSRPVNEETPDVITSLSEPLRDEQHTQLTSTLNLHNSLRQQMNRILTQIVTRVIADTETVNQEMETTEISDSTPSIATSNHENNDNNNNNNDNNNNDNNNSLSSTLNTPVVELSTSSITDTRNPVTIVHNESDSDDNDDENNRTSLLDLIFGENSRIRMEADEDDDNNDIDMNDIVDDDDSKDLQTSSSEHKHRLYTLGGSERTRKLRETCRAREAQLLRDIPSLGLLNSYEGHRNSRTMIKEANFWSDSYVMSGSDCGHIFIWNKFSGRIVRIIPADQHVVNCVQPHPHNYPILASSGIDYDVKIFSPLAEWPIDDTDFIDRTVTYNSIMAKEISNTIAIPASLMLRMLTSMYRLRNQEETDGIDDEDDNHITE